MIVSARTMATSALMSGVKPSRIIAHSRIGRVLSVPVTRSVISVSSKDSAKLNTPAPISVLRRLGRMMWTSVCQAEAPRSADASIMLGPSDCRRTTMVR